MHVCALSIRVRACFFICVGVFNRVVLRYLNLNVSFSSGVNVCVHRCLPDGVCFLV